MLCREWSQIPAAYVTLTFRPVNEGVERGRGLGGREDGTGIALFSLSSLPLPFLRLPLRLLVNFAPE